MLLGGPGIILRVTIRAILLSLSAALSVMLVHSSSSAGATFERTYGGSSRDHATSLDRTRDGGYIIAGQAASFGPGPVLLKTDSLGRTLWTRQVRSEAQEFSGFSVLEAKDGGYILSASYWCCPRKAGMLVVRTDSAGTELWRREYAGPGKEYSWGSCVEETRDRGFVVTGGVGLSPYVVRIDRAGRTVWEKTYRLGIENPCRSVAETGDGGYVVAGGQQDMFLLRLDPSGNVLWAKSYGGTDRDEGQWVEPTSDGGYIVAGCTESRGSGGKDAYLVKTDSSGRVLWSRSYGTQYSEMGYCVRETSDGGYAVAGVTHSLGGSDDDVYLFKTDSSGNPVWVRSFGGDQIDKAFFLESTPDRGFALVGYTGSCKAGDLDIYLVKTDSLGLVESLKDAAVVDVSDPQGPVRAGSVSPVTATVRGPGSSCLEYAVVASVEGEYADTVIVDTAEPGEIRSVSFAQWAVLPGGDPVRTLTVYVDLKGDTDPANDFVQREITVR